MSNITWPQVVGTYKGRLSFIRTQFQFIASWLDKSAQALVVPVTGTYATTATVLS